MVDQDPRGNTTLRKRNVAFINGYLNVVDDVLLLVPASAVVDLLPSPVPIPSSSTPPGPSSSPSASASPTPEEEEEKEEEIMTPEPVSPTPSKTAKASRKPKPSPSSSMEPIVSPQDEEEEEDITEDPTFPVTESPALPGQSQSATPSMPPSASASASVGSGGGLEDPTFEPSASPEEDDEGGVCFPAPAQVHKADGSIVRMDELSGGVEVRTSVNKEDQEKRSSKIFLFTHRNKENRGRCVRVRTACGHELTLTASHYIRNSEGHLIAAGVVGEGETTLQTVDGSCKVESIEKVTGMGLYAPHSLHGDLIMDGVVVSSYSKAVHPALSHALLTPLGWVSKWLKVDEPMGKTFYNGADGLLRFIPGVNARAQALLLVTLHRHLYLFVAQALLHLHHSSPCLLHFTSTTSRQ